MLSTLWVKYIVGNTQYWKPTVTTLPQSLIHVQHCDPTFQIVVHCVYMNKMTVYCVDKFHHSVVTRWRGIFDHTFHNVYNCTWNTVKLHEILCAHFAHWVNVLCLQRKLQYIDNSYKEKPAFGKSSYNIKWCVHTVHTVIHSVYWIAVNICNSVTMHAQTVGKTFMSLDHVKILCSHTLFILWSSVPSPWSLHHSLKPVSPHCHNSRLFSDYVRYTRWHLKNDIIFIIFINFKSIF